MIESETATGIGMDRTDAHGVGGVVWRTLLWVVFVLLTIPQCVSQMGIGLDASWGTGLHLSIDRGLVYGRDFLFTYGPLGFAMVAKELGGVGAQAVALRFGLLLFWWASVGLLLFRVKGYVTPLVFATAMALNGLPLEHEFNFALIGMLILTVACYLLLAELDQRPAWAIPAAFLAGAAMLTKFNVGVACTGALGAWSLYRLARNPTPRVFLRLTALSLVYFGSLAAFFRAYGGPISWLPAFIRGSKELASAYSTQMGLDDPASSVPLVATALIATLLGLGISLWRRSSLAPAFVIMIFPMFILYKGAVVRQSVGHFLLSWPVMVSLAALVLPAASRSLRPRIASTLIVAAIVASGFHYAPTSIQTVATRGARNWIDLCHLEQTLAQAERNDAVLKESRPLPAAMRARIAGDTVDIYPWETSYIWSNDLNWRPRPVFQSYTAYTPYLDQLGAELYRGPRAPKFIVYTHYAIDYQHPCIVDSRTWIEMYRWYDCVDQDGDVLLLQRRNDPRWTGAERMETASMGFQQSYKTPAAGQGLVFLKAKFELSLPGKLQAFFYKVDPPLIRVDYKDGEPANHRLVWQNAAGGFLLSSLPRDVDGVRRLFDTGVADPVVGVSFHDPSKRLKPEFKITSLKSGGPATAPAPAAVATAAEAPAAR